MDLNEIAMNDDFRDDRNEKSLNNGLSSPLSSEESTRISLQYIREQKHGLSKHRQNLLNKVLGQEKWELFPLNSVSDRDLAYLSAFTGDEFALLRGKNEDILYHGTQRHCHIEQDKTLTELLKHHKIRLECHSHPDYDTIIPS